MGDGVPGAVHQSGGWAEGQGGDPGGPHFKPNFNHCHQTIYLL